ncbi:MAG: L-rhamnose mutarotase [Chloroflexi bacterium]|nr:L-rhamnose mutarotase [Chloroflexota bacterium]
MQRFGQIIRLKPEQYDEYKRLHADVWPDVLAKLREANITRYSIYHRGGLLFAYFEYVGDDFAADRGGGGGRGAGGRGGGGRGAGGGGGPLASSLIPRRRQQ